MNYYIDAEFDEDGKTIELISLALVREDCREFYLESIEFDPEYCNDWVKANVLPHLTPQCQCPLRAAVNELGGASGIAHEPKCLRRTRAQIREGVERFIGDDKNPVFWGWFSAYDWVVFCQLWGPMIAKPKAFPYYCNDLQQLATTLHIRELDVAFPQTGARYPRHVAIGDARWNRDVHQQLQIIRGRDLAAMDKFLKDQK